MNDRDPDGDPLAITVVEPLPPALEVRVEGEELAITARAGSAGAGPVLLPGRRRARWNGARQRARPRRGRRGQSSAARQSGHRFGRGGEHRHDRRARQRHRSGWRPAADRRRRRRRSRGPRRGQWQPGAVRAAGRHPARPGGPIHLHRERRCRTRGDGRGVRSRAARSARPAAMGARRLLVDLRRRGRRHRRAAQRRRLVGHRAEPRRRAIVSARRQRVGHRRRPCPLRPAAGPDGRVPVRLRDREHARPDGDGRHHRDRPRATGGQPASGRRRRGRDGRNRGRDRCRRAGQRLRPRRGKSQRDVVDGPDARNREP